MLRTKPRLSAAMIASVFLFLGACASVQEQGGRNSTRGAKQTNDGTKPGNRVSVPDLDERSDDKQYLSKIDALNSELMKYKKLYKTADIERNAAVKAKNDALANEQAQIDDIEAMETLLNSAVEREQKLKATVLRTRIDLVRARKSLAEMKIESLMSGGSR